MDRHWPTGVDQTPQGIAMTQFTSVHRLGFAPRRRPNGLLATVMWIGGAVAAAAAMLVGAVLAVVTAAAVAVIALFAGALVFLTGLALRARGAATVRARASDGVIEARKVDGAWVAYGWEQRGR
jgi:hypothetical protein